LLTAGRNRPLAHYGAGITVTTANAVEHSITEHSITEHSMR
jgi:hypothetical protein